MPLRIFQTAFLPAIIGIVSISAVHAQKRSLPHVYLIAHRGGVVDGHTAENSISSLQTAYARGYKMVEIDMRATRDGHLITNHDASLKKYYGLDKPVSSLNWSELKDLTGTNGNHVLQLEQVFAYCSSRMAVMIDNKIEGNDTVLLNALLAMLRKYKLDQEALMIGTDESTEFFTGKIKLSCTRKQLEENSTRSDYRAENYYLFGSDLSNEDVLWAKNRKILTIGVLNAWTFHQQHAEAEVNKSAQKTDRHRC